MKKIAVLSRKGGAGKTTVAVNLALAGLAAGKKVLLADIDPQRSTLEALRGRADLGSLLVTTSAAKLFALSNDCERADYDLMIVDTAPAPEPDVIMAANVADLCLAVARPTFLDLAAVAQSIDLLRRLRRESLVVLTQCPAARGEFEAPAVARALEAMRYTGMPVAPMVLRTRAAYQLALAHSQSLAEFGKDDKAAGEFAALYAYVVDQLGEDTRAAPPIPAWQLMGAQTGSPLTH